MEELANLEAERGNPMCLDGNMGVTGGGELESALLPSILPHILFVNFCNTLIN